MNVYEIKDPSFLKIQSIESLEELASEIRAFLLAHTSMYGGHLSSNLGIVELTMALHYCFESPKDKLIFDVGHQGYVHKILTGRASQFSTMRQYGGISGFLKYDESIHDVWEAGHSSTSLSAAMGYALARDMQEQTHHIVPIIGDGSLTNGLALEALNHIGEKKEKLIIILNDNNMSISRNVGAINNILKTLRSKPMYQETKIHVKSTLRQIPKIGEQMVRFTSQTNGAISEFLGGMNMFKELGFAYIGAVDGHDFKSLISALEASKHVEGPVIVHIVTKKGKGYRFAEGSKSSWHGVAPFHLATGRPLQQTTGVTWSSHVRNQLEYEMERNERYAVVSAAMLKGSALDQLHEKYPKRVIDVGIAEEHAATMISSMKRAGLEPFYAIYSTFLQRAFDQILHDNALQKTAVTVGIDRAGIVGEDGETHQGVFDVAFLNIIPNTYILMPYTVQELAECFAVLHGEGPKCIRYSKDVAYRMDDELYEVYRAMNGPLTSGSWRTLIPSKEVKIPSKTEQQKKPIDATIISYGPVLSACEEARDLLDTECLNVRVVNAISIKPMDYNVLDQLLEEGYPILFVEEGIQAGGLSESALSYLVQNGATNQMDILAIQDTFVAHGKRNEILTRLGFHSEHIIHRLKTLINP